MTGFFFRFNDPLDLRHFEPTTLEEAMALADLAGKVRAVEKCTPHGDYIVDGAFGHLCSPGIDGELVEPSVSLDKLEAILYRENSVIAAEDVAILLATIYQEIGAEVPERILREAEVNNRAD